MAQEARFFARIADGLPEAARLACLKDAGFVGVVLAPSLETGRLLEAQSPAALAGFLEDCRRQGLGSALAGALEPADVPRLLALQPDYLLFDGAWAGQGRASGIDPLALDEMRRLMPQRSLRHCAEPADTMIDRVFVRDHVVEMALGAYSRERGLRQRVRFSVEADVARAVGEAREMADVFSYDVMTDTIGRLVAAEHIEFVETIAERLAEEVLRDLRVVRVFVRVEKLDLGSGTMGIEIWRSRRSRLDPRQ